VRNNPQRGCYATHCVGILASCAPSGRVRSRSAGERPGKVYSATEDHDIKFHQVHAKDNGRIRYKRVCEADGEVVEYGDIAGPTSPTTAKWW